MHPNFPEYDYPLYRPPNEAGSALIRITRGCPWNRCEFCAMYKHLHFRIKSVEEIRADTLQAREIYGPAETLFLGDSDNLVHPRLPEIVSIVKDIFPEARRITSYARAKTIIKRKPEFLTAIREAGLTRLHLGLESGDEKVLKRLNKGISPTEMVEAGTRAKDTGFEVSFYVLSGAGGQDHWHDHALNSARVLNQAKPDYIRLRTLTVLDFTPLAAKLAQGQFVLTPPLERLREVKIFITNLELHNCFLASDHVTNFLWRGQEVIYRGTAGELPQDKSNMIKVLDQAILRVKKSPAAVRDSNQLYQDGSLRSL